MVKMLISEFARRAALSPDTVRYYVRSRLLSPKQGTRGGRNPYQEFSESDLRIADVIRFGQALGMSLKEIGAVLGAGHEGQLEILEQRRNDLQAKGEELLRLSRYLDAKIAWIKAGSKGAPPELQHVMVKSVTSDDCQ